MTISHEYAEELGRQIDELEAENERLRSLIPTEPQEVVTKLVKELRGLGSYRSDWPKSADSYFSHTGGRVHLGEVEEFFDKAVRLADKAADALSEFSGAPAPSGWQPIETAPKGKTILLFAVTDVDEDGRVRNWKMATGFWHNGWDVGKIPTVWVWDGDRVPEYAVKPTHWMPLPPPPEITP